MWIIPPPPPCTHFDVNTVVGSVRLPDDMPGGKNPLLSDNHGSPTIILSIT